MMDDYKSVIMYFVWGHGLLPTTVLVDWFLKLELSFSYDFRPEGHKWSCILTKLSMINDNGSMMMCVVFSQWSSDHIRSGPLVSRAKMAFFSYFLHSKWHFKLDLNQT